MSALGPVRIQRQRSAGWRMPEGAMYVGRPTKFGNRFRVGEALMREPAVLDPGQAAELEGRISRAGSTHHPYFLPDGTRVDLTIRKMTAEECVEHYRLALLGTPTPAMLSASPSGYWAGRWSPRFHRWIPTTVDVVRGELRGRDLACWCPLDQPCHADVLLAVANA